MAFGLSSRAPLSAISFHLRRVRTRPRFSIARTLGPRRNSAKFLMLLGDPPSTHPVVDGNRADKFGLTVWPLWSKRGRRGPETPMSVRATSLALLFGAMVLGSASAAEPTGATPPQTRAPNDF